MKREQVGNAPSVVEAGKGGGPTRTDRWLGLTGSHSGPLFIPILPKKLGGDEDADHSLRGLPSGHGVFMWSFCL